MKLKAFQEKNKKKTLFIMESILLVLLITIVVVLKTYAIYQEQKEYDVIEGSVPEFMDNFDVKVALTIDGIPSTKFPEKGSGKTVDSIVCNKGATASWDYAKWDIVIHNVKETKTKCQVSFVTKYTDSVLNGNDPVLAENLIPVTIENQNGENVVKKASQKDAWYDYTGKKWANAVILVDENETYTTGQVIPEEKIESYFVWIPKFQYKIFNTTNYPNLTSVDTAHPATQRGIDVQFASTSTIDTSTSCKSPNKSGDIGTCSVGKWMTHPAFVDGFEGIKGMWVGKFETVKAGGDTNIVDPGNLQIKPGVSAWRSVNVSNAFYSSYHYQRNLDSHMMKNTEWGAVAYLTQSIYGKCSSLTHCEEVRVNNNTEHLTGYSALHNPTTGYSAANLSCSTTPLACNEYGTSADITKPWNDVETLGFASTTGNLSGIYDMSGNSWEFVMGVMLSQDGRLVSGRSDNYNSNFMGVLTNPSVGNDTNKSEWYLSDGGVSFPETKYFDTYTYGVNFENYGRMILGDATGEMGPFANNVYNTQTRHIGSWFDDEGWFVSLYYPWFYRSGSAGYGTGSGVFSFVSVTGNENGDHSFRVVLSP